MSSMSRRTFVQSVVCAAVAGSIPIVDARSILGAQSVGDPILVTVEMAGGNDALNTIGRFGLGRYRDMRGSMAIPVSSALPLEPDVFAHPRLQNIARRYRAGSVAVIEGVGDSRYDRSHFSGLARWQSGRANGGVSTTGWLGRWLDGLGVDAFGGIAVAPVRLPLHLTGRTGAAITVSPDSSVFDIDRSTQIHRTNTALMRDLAGSGSLGAVARQQMAVTHAAMTSAPRVAPAVTGQMPDNNFVRDCTVAHRLLALDLGTRVVNVRLDGFDTHARQVAGNAISGDHADKLQALDVGIDTLLDGLPTSIRERVVVLVYSEFGRRPAPNGAAGTDHGTAGTALLVGDSVRGGMYGETPSLQRLDSRGDMFHTVPFQDVYAAVLDQHLNADIRGVLGGSATPVASMIRSSGSGGSSGGSGPRPAPTGGSLRDRAAEIRNRRRERHTDYLRYHSPHF